MTHRTVPRVRPAEYSPDTGYAVGDRVGRTATGCHPVTGLRAAIGIRASSTFTGSGTEPPGQPRRLPGWLPRCLRYPADWLTGR